MTFFRKMIQFFIKIPQVMGAYVLLLLGCNVYMFQLLRAFLNDAEVSGVECSDSINFIGDVRIICFLLFVFWFFISYEYFRKLKESDIEEVLVSVGVRKGLVYTNQVLVLISAIGVLVANITVYVLIGYVKLKFPELLVGQMLHMLFIDCLLLSIASSFVGILVSRIRARLGAYIVLAVLILFNMPDYFELLLEQFWGNGEFLCEVKKFISILPPDISGTYDGLYGLPFEWYRISGMLLWILLGSFWMVYKSFHGKRMFQRMICGVYVGVLIILVLGITNRGSVLLMNETIREANMYYNMHEGQEEEAGYEITAYDMELSVNNELDAICKVKIEASSEMSEYKFTLYHGYKIKEVRNQSGTAVSFEQNGDYVQIMGEKAQTNEEFTFAYEGSSDLFYSNKESCFLSGIFPFYPQAGWRTLFDDQCKLIPYHTDPISFSVKMDYPGELVSNLTYKDGRWTGVTDSLLFVSGNIDEERQKERKICYPLQKSSYEIVDYYSSEEFQKTWKEQMEFLGTPQVGYQTSTDLVVCIPYSSNFMSLANGYYELDSHILVMNSGNIYDVIREQIFVGQSTPLMEAFLELEPSQDSDVEFYTIYKDLYGEDSSDYQEKHQINDLMVEKMKEKGVQEIASKVFQYLLSESYQGDTAKDIEFVRGL